MRISSQIPYEHFLVLSNCQFGAKSRVSVQRLVAIVPYELYAVSVSASVFVSALNEWPLSSVGTFACTENVTRESALY